MTQIIGFIGLALVIGWALWQLGWKGGRRINASTTHIGA